MRKKYRSGELVGLNVRIPAELHKRMKVSQYITELSQEKTVEAALEGFLKKISLGSMVQGVMEQDSVSEILKSGLTEETKNEA